MNLFFQCMCFVVLFLCNNCAWAYANCERKDISAGPGVSLKVQQTKGQAGLNMLSSVWHERSFPDFLVCSETNPSLKLDIGLMFAKASVGKYLFEGKSYALWLTNNPNIAVIYEHAFAGEAYVPVYFYARVAIPGNGGIVKKGYSYRFRYVSLNRLPAGELVVAGINGFFSLEVYEGGTPMFTADSALPPATISVNNTSCTLSAPSVVRLKKINLSLLSLVGETAGTVNFQIGVTCAASYAPYKILYALEDVNAPSNTTSNLILNSAGNSASGVSLQVLDGETPVVFGAQTSATTLKGELGDMGVQGGAIGKLFGVQYIRTGKMTPGTVNAGVTVTLSYE
ncbi:type 1 fimbria pilin [Pseudomonas brenneri]|nr:type 1 fimbria pilin [Pseudomonas brenneri]